MQSPRRRASGQSKRTTPVAKPVAQTLHNVRGTMPVGCACAVCPCAVTVNPEPVPRLCRLGGAAIPATELVVLPDTSLAAVDSCHIGVGGCGGCGVSGGGSTCSLEVPGGRGSCLLEQDEGQARGRQAGDPDSISAHQWTLRLVRLHSGRPRCQSRHKAVVRLEQRPCRTLPSCPPLPRCTSLPVSRRPVSEPVSPSAADLVLDIPAILLGGACCRYLPWPATS